MTFWQGVAYVLRHAWLWPLEFWLRPLDVLNRLKKADQANPEIICALLGGVVWGTFAGISVWLWTSEIQAIWILATAVTFAVTFAFALAGAIAGFGAFAGAFAGAVAFPIAFAGAFAGFFAFASAIAFAGAVIFIIAFTDKNTYTKITAIFRGNSKAEDISSDIFVAAFVGFFVAVIGFFLSFLAASVIAILVKHLAGDSASTYAFNFAIVFFFGFIIAAVIATAGIFYAAYVVTLTWLIALSIAGYHAFPYIFVGFGGFVGAIAGLGFEYNSDKQNGLKATGGGLNLRSVNNRQIKWVVGFWSLFLLLSLITFSLNPKKVEIKTYLEILSIFFFITPFIGTGLIFWPICSLISIWKFRTNYIPLHTTEYLISLPFFWQTFAYPLPHLRKYLTVLYSRHGFDITLRAIQAVQLRSLQIRASRCAIRDLANDPDTALSFCGQVAITTNSVTLIQLSLAGSAARAVAALAVIQKNEDEQPLWFYVGIPPLLFQNIRQQGLQERLAYALREIDACPPCTHLPNFRSLLQTLLSYAEVKQLQDIRDLPRIPEEEAKTGVDWLSEGWGVLARVKASLADLETYRKLTTPNARREYLDHKSEELQESSWDDLSEYWRNIGKEIVEHWLNLLKEEAPQAREWLRLEIFFRNQTVATGRQTLKLAITNPTATLAKNLRARVEETPGLHWHHIEARFPLLEGGKNTDLSLEMEVEREGDYRVAGTLEAEDLAGNPFTLPFVFQINAAFTTWYVVPPYTPYVVGEGLGDDRTFVGRTELLHWLRSLWLQPQGKPAVGLVGQRRIGKTSLLNKIKRDGLLETHLLPVLLNIQGIAGDYDFLNDTARQMAELLDTTRPTLDRSEPYADFKDFLLGLKSTLNWRRFLLMLDEADLIPQRRLGDLLPGFLRALMQEPEYPTLLLFCGTHALKRVSRDYASILFNTAQFRTVSYMTQAESAEVLEKPSSGILEFDPTVLEEAYRLTRGQPLLLQSLGAALINLFNTVVFNGGQRSRYVNLNDLNQAATELVEQGNAAFENHWEDSDAATHRVLSALAWATPETIRGQLDLPGIEAALKETRLELQSKMTFQIVDRLADEEILTRDGPTYRFAVPLYRRWIEWRWPPERVREEPLD